MKRRFDVPILDCSTTAGSRRLDAMLAGRRTRDEVTLRLARRITDDVRRRGDAAVLAYTRRFDGVRLNSRQLRVPQAEIERCASQVSPDLAAAMVEAAKRIRAYHSRQGLTPFTMATEEGRLEQMVLPLRRVGLYVPGGYTVYPSTVLMDVIPAQVAGVEEIAVVTPPRDGLAPELAFALRLLGLREVYRVGGAQAVAALAYGTASIPAVDKIVGPGRSVVAMAKRLVYGEVDIDMVAGPSEVAVVADGSADPRLLALDLLAQAEHGSGDEVALLITASRPLAQRVREALRMEAALSPVSAVFERLAAGAVCICLCRGRAASMALVNRIAPEHLQLVTRRPRDELRLVRNAGAVFLGPHTPVALGDYFVGTNHVLPTGGAARFASALGVDDFQKRVSVAQVSRSGLRRIAAHVSTFARAEALVHHAMCVERRVRGRR